MNLDREDVLDVVRFRDSAGGWPTTVEAYGKLMDAKESLEVRFTRGGDRDIVKFLFYRVCFGMLDAFDTKLSMPLSLGYQPPSENALKAVVDSPIGRGVLKGKYYLYVALPPPAVVKGEKYLLDSRHKVEKVLRSLREELLTEQERCLHRQHYPAYFSDALDSHLSIDLTEGRMHALVWGALGAGWEQQADGPATTLPSMSFDRLCSLVSNLGGPRCPAAIILCMPYGASAAATRLHEAGAPLVVWIGASLYDERRGQLTPGRGALLFGVVAPLLEEMHEPRMHEVTEASLTLRAQSLCARICGSWKAGCLFSPTARVLPLPKHEPSGNTEPWVHSVAMPIHVVRPDVRWRHEQIKLNVWASDGTPVDLMRKFADREPLVKWLSAALPRPHQEGSNEVVAALFPHMDLGCYPALYVRLLIGDIGYLHELRDMTLTGEVDDRLSRTKLGDVHYTVTVDRSQFALDYETTMLSLNTLTRHQEEKKDECLEKLKKSLTRSESFVHLKAPAGAGKTFVALHIAKQRLEEDPKACVLFIARNPALCYFVAGWLCMREDNPLQRVQMLRRVFVLFTQHGSFSERPRALELVRGKIIVNETRTTKPSEGYKLVIVDEAHHIFGNLGLKESVERYMHKTDEQVRLLLSDISQSTGRNINYGDGEEHTIELTEVVRSSQRIVAGAAAFQIENIKKVKCQHNASGPPLKSFLFELTGPPAEAYAQHTIRGLQHVVKTFGVLSLHNRVAILVKDEEFANTLRSQLAVALPAAFKERVFELIDATEAAKFVMHGHEGEGLGAKECLVVDTVAAFDGLERLVVLAVGLDAPIDSATASKSKATLESRCQLYRAVTRAHMLAVVVNEVVSGGFLTFLGKLSLKEEKRFEREVEVLQQSANAAAAVTEDAIKGAVLSEKQTRMIIRRVVQAQALWKRARAQREARREAEAAAEEEKGRCEKQMKQAAEEAAWFAAQISVADEAAKPEAERKAAKAAEAAEKAAREHTEVVAEHNKQRQEKLEQERRAAEKRNREAVAVDKARMREAEAAEVAGAKKAAGAAADADAKDSSAAMSGLSASIMAATTTTIKAEGNSSSRIWNPGQFFSQLPTLALKATDEAKERNRAQREKMTKAAEMAKVKISQSIWDTDDNTDSVLEAEVKFMPFFARSPNDALFVESGGLDEDTLFVNLQDRRPSFGEASNICGGLAMLLHGEIRITAYRGERHTWNKNYKEEPRTLESRRQGKVASLIRALQSKARERQSFTLPSGKEALRIVHKDASSSDATLAWNACDERGSLVTNVGHLIAPRDPAFGGSTQERLCSALTQEIQELHGGPGWAMVESTRRDACSSIDWKQTPHVPRLRQPGMPYPDGFGRPVRFKLFEGSQKWRRRSGPTPWEVEHEQAEKERQEMSAPQETMAKSISREIAGVGNYMAWRDEMVKLVDAGKKPPVTLLTLLEAAMYKLSEDDLIDEYRWYANEYTLHTSSNAKKAACEMIVIRIGKVVGMPQGARVAKRIASARLLEAQVTPRMPPVDFDDRGGGAEYAEYAVLRNMMIERRKNGRSMAREQYPTDLDYRLAILPGQDQISEYKYLAEMYLDEEIAVAARGFCECRLSQLGELLYVPLARRQAHTQLKKQKSHIAGAPPPRQPR